MKQSKELKLAIKAAKAAGKILMKNFRSGVSAKNKSLHELVTPVDVESEKAIVSMLEKEFPDYGILAEESASKEKKSDSTWIIDPIDGTHNYFFGLPMFAVSIALQKRDKIQCGVIFLPALNELYYAERGKGAFMNGKRISVSKRPMEKAVVAISARIVASPKRLDFFKEFYPKIFSSRNFGSACFALANLAAGNIDAAINFNNKPWDFAAGWLLVEEAGGILTAFGGTPASLSNGAYIASSGVFHEFLARETEGLK